MFLECRVSFKVYLYNLDGQTWPNDQREPDQIIRRRPRGWSHFQKSCTGKPATIHGFFNQRSEIMPRGCCWHSNGTLSDSDSTKSGKNKFNIYIYIKHRLIVRTNFFKISPLLVTKKWWILLLLFLITDKKRYLFVPYFILLKIET